MRKITRTTAAVAGSLTIAVAGLAGVAGASSIGHDTGPDSWNKLNSFNSTHVKTNNNNNVNVTGNNSQSAHTGDASSKHSTEGGGAKTGDASADNDLKVDLSVDNTGGACGCAATLGDSSDPGGSSIGNDTGPGSKNYLDSNNTVKVTTTNNNNINVTSNNTQKVKSGNASVKGNTEGGDASTGDATAKNKADIIVSVKN